MSKLKSIWYGGKEYPVTFKQTPNWSHTGMSKQGLVHHVTTSLSYEGGLSWLTDVDAQVSAMFIIGKLPGQIAQLSTSNQATWHAGGVHNPSEKFLDLAHFTEAGKIVNPNLYYDGIEYVGGVDTDRSGKVEVDEISLNEWQLTCGEAIARWHAEQNNYALDEDSQIIHQDISSGKPDMSQMLEEIKFRLFDKSATDVWECESLQAENIELKGMVGTMISLVTSILKWRR